MSCLFRKFVSLINKQNNTKMEKELKEKIITELYYLVKSIYGNCGLAAINKVEIKKEKKDGDEKVSVYLHTQFPPFLIGKGGSKIAKVSRALAARLDIPAFVNVVDVEDTWWNGIV